MFTQTLVRKSTVTLATIDIELLPADNNRLANLCGQLDSNLRHIERRLGIEINNRGNRLRLIGASEAITNGASLLQELYQHASHDTLVPEHIHMSLQEVAGLGRVPQQAALETIIKTRCGVIRPRGVNQQEYLQRIMTHDINFGVGPAGTGKTYLAVACAVEALERDAARRIVLVRPAVEAGERLGFLPGDLAQKIDPYLRPLYDALHEMLGFEKVGKLIERNIIELAPLAYMRGRTLNHSFIILDEAQNTTPEQMKMFLTRIGCGSIAVITGDVTQIDLPHGQKSGLRQAIEILNKVSGISFTFFTARDVVRHELVQRIVHAYEQFEATRHDRPA